MIFLAMGFGLAAGAGRAAGRRLEQARAGAVAALARPLIFVWKVSTGS